MTGDVPSGRATGLDHVGIVGPDLAALAGVFARLGFIVTPRATHAGGRTGNHCVMLDSSYLELISNAPGGASATLDRFMARYLGIHILALGMADEDAVLARLGRAGFADLHAAPTERVLNDAEPNAPRVGFNLITPPDLPEGRVHLIRHRDRAALWQDRFLAHPNRATALREVLVISDLPAETAARFSRLAGWPVTPDPDSGYALDLPRGRLRLLPPTALPTPTRPWIGGLTLTTADGNAALSRLLADRAIPHDRRDNMIVVEAAGVLLRFLADKG